MTYANGNPGVVKLVNRMPNFLIIGFPTAKQIKTKNKETCTDWLSLKKITHYHQDEK